jgi:hypothetical protein
VALRLRQGFGGHVRANGIGGMLSEIENFIGANYAIVSFNGGFCRLILFFVLLKGIIE